MAAKSKHDLLIEEEMSDFHLAPRVMQCIDDCADRLGVGRQEMRVLDWGCGRGRTVLKLLELGIDAYGVDIDPGPIRNGSQIMKERGFDPEQRLICISSDCLTPFADEFFHVVLSEQVFEHVSDLDALSAELLRITIPGGGGLHVFPAKWRVIEPHLFVPFVHWLPKNRIRYWYLYLMAKRIPVWRSVEDKRVAERVEVYYDYLINKTYYRSLKKIFKTFYAAGFDAFLWPGGRPGRKLKLLMPFLLFNTRFSSKFWSLWFSSFHQVVLRTIRRQA